MEVRIRKWAIEDCEVLYELGKDAVLRTFWNPAYLYPDTLAHAKTCIAFYRSADAERFIIHAIVWKGQVCGWLQAERKDEDAVELSYWLGSNYTKKGIMHEAMLQLLEQIHKRWDETTIYARVDDFNMPSIHVLQHLHFQQENLDGQTKRFFRKV